jgi:hypothetical protein
LILARFGALLWAALLMSFLATVLPANAENLGPGGGTRVVVGDQIVGPYRLWVTTSPEPAQTGLLTILVRVTDPNTGKKITDGVTIEVALVNPEDGTRLTGAATHHDAGNPVDYVAHFQMPAAGSWSGSIHINGPAGPADVTFVARVLSPRSSSTLVLMGLPFLAVVAFLGGAWYWRSARRSFQVA